MPLIALSERRRTNQSDGGCKICASSLLTKQGAKVQLASFQLEPRLRSPNTGFGLNCVPDQQ